ncbi:hypothetical protein BOSEA31B_20335 [Hyphomicrobiales bacterium]|nr:hypothetical protein BOSEA31B_20335 [Hyphomicrobiales bacterium]CAH1702290.1 hypothetical protein BOSEA1005_30162 [Hyphomicrobiales bacterium]CAI0346492.1 hypothetical protein BO1005MUT1_520004 [Hyphomicrobiales bacterium]
MRKHNPQPSDGNPNSRLPKRECVNAAFPISNAIYRKLETARPPRNFSPTNGGMTRCGISSPSTSGSGSASG